MSKRGVEVLEQERWVEVFLAEKKLSVAPSTLKSYRVACGRFVRHLKKRRMSWKKEEPLEAVTGEDVLSYLRERASYFSCKSGEVSKSSLSGDSSRLRVFLRFCFERGYLFEDLSLLVESQRRCEKRRQALTFEEVEEWMALCDGATLHGARNRVFFEMAYGTGLRSSELLGLELSHLDLKKGLVRVEKTKNGRERYVPLPKGTLGFLSFYLQKVRPRFRILPGSETALWLTLEGRKMTRAAVDKACRTMRRRWGGKKRVSSHLFRHTYAYHLQSRGVDVRHIQELLGHRYIASTEYYLQEDLCELRQVLVGADWCCRRRTIPSRADGGSETTN